VWVVKSLLLEHDPWYLVQDEIKEFLFHQRLVFSCKLFARALVLRSSGSAGTKVTELAHKDRKGLLGILGLGLIYAQFLDQQEDAEDTP